jgi:hypothetical protein
MIPQLWNLVQDDKGIIRLEEDYTFTIDENALPHASPKWRRFFGGQNDELAIIYTFGMS